MVAVDDVQKKRHHYVPVAYLDRFADSDGRIYAFRKDDPAKPLHLRPSEIAFERYYYSQPLPEGGQDNNRLENFFSKIEAGWPALIDDLSARRDLGSRIEQMFEFIALLRVRGPAARDPVELYLAHIARRKMLALAESGRLTPPPSGLTFDDIEISIDPHQSIHAMVPMVQGFAKLWEFCGLEVVHNTTPEPFATSDNPVIVFDPDVAEARLLPYTVRLPGGRVELLVPISPTVLLRGSTELAVIRPGDRLRHVEMTSRAAICRVNRLVSRFGYRFVFANHPGLQAVVTKYAALSPTIRFDVGSDADNGEFNFIQMVFGPKPQKPKWRARAKS